MHVVPYHSGYLASVVGLYNQMTKGVPHCHPITPSDLAEAFNGGCGIESDGRKMRKEAILVAVEDEPIGFVHVGEGITPEKLGIEGVQGNIRFLCYPRGRRDVGQLLLEHAEAWVRDAGLDSMLVYRQNYRYPFYHFAHAFISNHLEHVQALLLLNEYVTCGGEVFLDWPNMAPTRPSGSGGLEVDLKVVVIPAGEERSVEVRYSRPFDGVSNRTILQIRSGGKKHNVSIMGNPPVFRTNRGMLAAGLALAVIVYATVTFSE